MNLLNGLKCSVIVLLCGFSLCFNSVNAQRATVDLAGEWKFSTSLAGDSAITVKLPGTTDTNGVGVINDNHGETTQLTRRITLILDALNDTDYRPLVQVIDNVERNHRLGLVMEFNVDKGKLLLVMADIDKASSTREGRQLLNSLVGYMNSDAFSPDATLSLKQLEELLTVPASSLRIDALHNISYD